MTQPRLKLKAHISECTFSSLQMDFKIFLTYNFLKKKKKKKECGNGIAEIGGKKKFAIGLWQCHCRNRRVEKKNWNCEKWNGIQQCHCHNSIPLFFFFLK